MGDTIILMICCLMFQIKSGVIDKSAPNELVQAEVIVTDEEVDEVSDKENPFIEAVKEAVEIENQFMETESSAVDTEEEELSMDEDEDEFMEKTAVSRAMERLLEDMDQRPESASSSNDMDQRTESMSSSIDMEPRSESLSSYNDNVKNSSGNEGDDNVFIDKKRQSSSKSSQLKADFFASPPEPIRLDAQKAIKGEIVKTSFEIEKEAYVAARSASSDNYGKNRSGSGIKNSTRLSKSSDDLEKRDNLVTSGSNFNDTEKAVLNSVRQMSDNSSTGGSGDTILQVLKSVEKFKETPGDQVPKCIQYLDDRFVTQSRGGRPKKQKRRMRKSKASVPKSSSSDSMNISTPPSHSPLNSSSTSLSEEWNYNKQFVSESTLLRDDEKPDEDMLKEYQITVSQILDDDELSPQENGLNNHDDDLDQTLNADESAEAVSPKSEYYSPKSDLSGVSEYVSPKSDRNSSIYVTPDTSLTEKTAEDVSSNFSPSADDRSPVTPEDKKTKTKVVPVTNDRKKRMASSRKPLKVIKQNSKKSEDESTTVPFSSDTLIRARRQSREGSTEPSNHLERDAWGSRSSSCSSVSEGHQQSFRPLPPVPAESASSPKQSKAFKQGGGRKLPDTTNLKTKNGNSQGAFQSNFMKKAFGSPGKKDSDQNVEQEEVDKVSIEEIKVETNVSSQPQPRALPPRPVDNEADSAKEIKDSKPKSKSVTDTETSIGTKADITKGKTSENTPSAIDIKDSKSKGKIASDLKTATDIKDKSNCKTKIPVDFSKLKLDRDSESGEESQTKKKKIIPVDKAVKSAIKPKLIDNRKTSPTNSDDIPFADDSEDDKLNGKEKFYTPLTSVKPKKKIPVDESAHKDVRKRLLPSPPDLEPAMLSPEHIRDIKKAEIEKAREEARERARLKSDEELGLKDMGLTPGAKYKRTASQESSGPSGAEILSDSDNLKGNLTKASVTFTPDLPVLNGAGKTEKAKKKKKKSRDRDESISNSNENLDDTKKEKDKKKRSLVSMLQVFKTPNEKSKDLKEKDRSSSNDTLEEKPQKKKKSKTPKSEKKKDKKKRKSEGDEGVLSDGLKELKIGSVFTEGAGRRPGFQGKILPPKASGECNYRKVPKFWDARKLGCNLPKIRDQT